MAKNTIPKIMSTRTLKHLDKKLVWGNLVNRSYEGEIASGGDQVTISRVKDITVKDYVPGSLGSPEEIKTEQVTLVIDKKKSYEFGVDDIEKVQSNIQLFEDASERAAVSMAQQTDMDIAREIVANGTHLNDKDTAVTVTQENVYDLLVDVRVAMSKNNVPHEGRSIVLSPEIIGLLEKDPRFTKSEDVLRNGFKGRAAGLDIFESNNIVEDEGVQSIAALTPESGTFANNIVQSEVLRSQTTFGDIVRGLHVYGVKVIQPEATAIVHVKVERSSALGAVKAAKAAAPAPAKEETKEEAKEDEKKTK